eukprot:TRINITY_DN3124_c0_g1_i1.p1 TRINITY_DN3124_c0_g1~~TRINITY_DN3124_c0_g1_i1.p1  ORF type:complete len:612 (-),score=67.58 TRINITY_DN3124_c0_g1_i1:184-2019(-)
MLPSCTRGTLPWLATRTDFSLLTQLRADPEYEKYEPNKGSRQVRSGHYVPVEPTPLPHPYLVAYSRNMAQTLGLSDAECTSPPFAQFFSGDIRAVEGFKSWATPYALSIYGQEMYQNCPFGTGNGYGDGRAVSVGEVVVDGRRWEMQLKGGGKTPFCRGADGRAVLRSSVREFLASEAMFHLGVETTRALSLVASKTEKVQRAWFSGKTKTNIQPDDPRLKSYPPELLPFIISQLQGLSKEPDILQDSICAITCRVAPSFIRVGQVELFGRRYRAAKGKGGEAEKRTREELEMIVNHLIFREYPDIHASPATPQDKILAMLREVSKKIAQMTSDWLRVGFNQGNFNSDNCLVGGRTMDYGPFGFMEKFEAYWNMWTGGGKHFGFMNQNEAGLKNFTSFVDAVVLLLDEEGVEMASRINDQHREVAANTTNLMWATKLGLVDWDLQVGAVLEELLALMQETSADFTLVWRQLASVAERFLDEQGGVREADCEKAVIEPLKDCFYATLSGKHIADWIRWTTGWLRLLSTLKTSGRDIAARMRKVSPKFVPREWMLVKAYTLANEGDHSLVREYLALFEHPYEEQSEEQSLKYYRKAPAETYAGAGMGGTAFMT